MSGVGAAGLERVSLSDLDASGRAQLFEGEPKTVRLTLSAGEEVPPHQHPGRDIVFHLLDGEVDLTLGETTLSLSASDVARFDGEQDISPAAVTDCEALLVLATSE
ncbi:cupin domain-containing protein [Halomicroarcula sp. F13]|uniref:Cupin domain-containing protein n=1 Tax=Haloarcula rubra TaxID=2487747 RepID=A0AAW4PVR8_9EURY|nr:cupin domain-containing protein [Halomicroarcula rubra]MBX0324635.1 cupin domain-containing protein [Halomicroarcula rubra]